jgi:hypothetical protein
VFAGLHTCYAGTLPLNYNPFQTLILSLSLSLFFETGLCYVAEAGTHNPPASASRVLGLQLCATTPVPPEHPQEDLPVVRLRGGMRLRRDVSQPGAHSGRDIKLKMSQL